MKENNKKIILFLVNTDWFFVSHRLPIAKEALAKGFNVHIATTFSNKKEELANYGFKLHDIKIDEVQHLL